jgi:hydroxyacylglutathione hydrolase
LINPYREGAGAIGRAMESVERLAGLGARWACSGHGPAIVEPEWALAAARERYEGWLERPESAAWHACKRIAAYALIIRDGLAEGEATTSPPARGRPTSHATPSTPTRENSPGP